MAFGDVYVAVLAVMDEAVGRQCREFEYFSGRTTARNSGSFGREHSSGLWSDGYHGHHCQTIQTV
jgi:hypothetical protein